ncbi:MAG: fumarylpyruvate hydrolase [Rhodothalassiaceae bacterium]|nr:MAG: fumarylpyruvate hydrolase [Rhodothalassiaceae bacterium]
MAFLFDPAVPSLPIAGDERRFAVRRIFCVGRNYAAHAREMGMDPDREPPFFFMKPADAVVENGTDVPYPPATRNLHHEIELVVAIGKTARDLAAEEAQAVVFGYAVGNDLTRRDLQLAMREKGRPWEVGKAFDMSAPVTAIHPAARIGHPRRGRIWLAVNGERRQEADLADLIWSVPEILMHLSRLFTLKPGDLVFTGTPAGVGPLLPGDVVEGGVEGVDVLRHRIVAAGERA